MFHEKFALPSADQIRIEIDRRKAVSFREFAKMAWHILEPATPLKWGWALDAMCDHLQAVTDGDLRRLLMNVPPGTMKSLLTSVMWCAYEWGPRKLPHHRFIGTAHMQALAVRDAMKCRRLITSPWFQARWPMVLTDDQNTKTKFENDRSGFREAMAFGSMTGSRGDRITVDDPLSVDQANSEAERYRAALTFTEALPTRVNNDKSAIVVIMQRLHEGDTSGIILDNDLGYEHLCLPMEFEPDRRCSTSIGFTDPRTEPGDLLLPERFDAAAVAELKKSLMAVGGHYAVAGQLQQRPAPRGGGMFKREWFPVVDAAPAACKWVRGWDLAATESTSAAWTAGVKIGRSPDGRFWIADATRIQGSAAQVERLLVSTASQDGSEVRGSLPQDPGQAGKAQAGYLIRQLAGYAYHATPETGDKETRAAPLAAQAEAGNVSLIRGEWNKAFLDEMTVFPASQFKDQVDAASRAFNVLLHPEPYVFKIAL